MSESNLNKLEKDYLQEFFNYQDELFWGRDIHEVPVRIDMWLETDIFHKHRKTGICKNCKHWKKEQSRDNYGECAMLSATSTRIGKEEVRDIEEIGVESYPMCQHDGPGFYYTTKDWFSCIHYNE